ncbi:MAG: Uma2 family endonuclease [Deltaproteobacteria bacterium]|nr:Uma2 family endonuclease [Deltaproteobacteria bacterium]
MRFERQDHWEADVRPATKKLPELLSEAEYLEGERLSPIKYEFIDGHVFAMAGASKAHATISLNVAMVLRNHLKGKPCQAYMLDLKVHIAKARAYYYPDVLATCDPSDLAADAPSERVTAPCLVVEVLSPSTEATDRREKWLNYRMLPSLQEYVLIDQARCWVELYRRSGEVWQQTVLSEPDHLLELASVGVAIPLRAVYEDVALAPLSA